MNNNLVLMSTDTRPGLMELRIALEIGIADLLITRKTQKDLLEFEEILMHEAAYPTRDVSKQDNIDSHLYFFQIAGNDYIEKFLVLLEQIFTCVYDYLEKKDEFLEVSPATHRVLLQELKRGTAESLRQAIRSHLQPHKDIIKREKDHLKSIQSADS